MSTVATARAQTRTMSCRSTIVVVADTGRDAASLARVGERRLHELERRWSRFLPSSEVSRLNAAGGATCHVSADTVRLVEALVRAWHATEGAFDPTLLGPLVELGYAASRDDETVRTSLPSGWSRRGPTEDVRVDRVAGVVQLPPGMTLDPGGLGKGLAADLISTELVDGGAAGALVEIGGDLAVRGTAPGPGGWSIAVADPYGDTSALRVELLTGGVATSSSRIRTWLAGGRRLHHLLDPSTLQPTEGDVVACTVIAGTAAWGEASTKVAFVDGLDAGLEYYTRSGLAARVSTVDGRHHRSPAWKEFVR